MASEHSPLLSEEASGSRRSWLQSFVNPSSLWRSGAVLSTIGIISGAFGSHGLKSRLTSDQLDNWKVASNYAIFNGVALLAISMHPRFGRHAFAGPAILSGATIFSLSIMALVLNRDRFRFLGPVTPIGGSIMIAGYIVLIL